MVCSQWPPSMDAPFPWRSDVNARSSCSSTPPIIGRRRSAAALEVAARSLLPAVAAADTSLRGFRQSSTFCQLQHCSPQPADSSSQLAWPKPSSRARYRSSWESAEAASLPRSCLAPIGITGLARRNEKPLEELAAELLLRRSPSSSKPSAEPQCNSMVAEFQRIPRSVSQPSLAAKPRSDQEPFNLTDIPGGRRLRSCLRNDAMPPRSAPEHSRRVSWSSPLGTVVAVTPSASKEPPALRFGTCSGNDWEGLPGPAWDKTDDADFEVDFLQAALHGASADDSYGCSTAPGDGEDSLEESEDTIELSCESDINQDLGWSPQKLPAMTGTCVDLHSTWRRPAPRNRIW